MNSRVSRTYFICSINIGSTKGRTKVAATQIMHARNAAVKPPMTAFAYATESKYERTEVPRHGR